MTASLAVVRYNQQDHTLTFRVEGRATMTQSLPLRRFAERALESGTTRLQFDLRDCLHMDSTFLGTILTLKKAIDRLHGELAVVCPSDSCTRIFQQMGIADMFLFENKPFDAQQRWTELPCRIEDPSLLKRNIVQAHEELAKLPGKAGEEFQAVVRCMNEAKEKTRPSE